MGTVFKDDELVELLVDANAIPAGCYRFKMCLDEIILLSVAEDLLIGLHAGYWQPFLQKVTDPARKPTSVSRFIDEYFRALPLLKTSIDCNDLEKQTFCLMAPHYQPLAFRGAPSTSH